MGALERTPDRRPALLSRPQPLGFLPTLRYWADPEVFRLSLPIRMAMATGLASILAILGAAGILLGSWWVYVGLMGTGMILGVGQLERYIRREAKKRR